MPSVRDFLGFVVNPPPGDPSRTAGSDLLPKAAVLQPAGTPAGQVPVSDGAGGITWVTGRGPAIAARGYSVGGASCNGVSVTRIATSTVAFDTSGIIDGSGHFNIPTSGKYAVMGQVGLSGSLQTGAYQVYVEVDGLTDFHGQQIVAPASAPFAVGLVVAVVLQLSAGDVVDLYARSLTSGSSATTVASTGGDNFLSIAFEGS